MKRLNYKRAGTFTAGLIIVLFVILNTAHNAHGDGEIILCPGDKYAIPCLAQLLPGQEYEIEIENPDIVGLDETGKSIVAIAAGTTEVTVRLMNPDAGYLYVFAVADVFAQPATGIYDEPEKDYVYEQYTDEMGAYGWDSENVSEPYEYDGVSPSSQGNGTGRTNNEPGADAHVGTGQGAGVDTDKDADSGTERGAGGDRDLDADAGTEQSAESRGQAPIQTKTRMPAQSRVRAAIQTGMRMPVQSRGQAPIQTKTRMPAQSRDQIMTQTEVTICRGIIFAIRLLHLRTEPENMIFSFRRITLCGSVRTVRVLYRSCMSE